MTSLKSTINYKSDPNSIIISNTEYNRIKNLIERPIPFLTKFDKKDKFETHYEDNLRLRKDKAFQNNLKLQQFDELKANKLNKELNENKEADNLLNFKEHQKRGYYDKYDEIQYMNRLMNTSKCLAIRDNQVKESCYIRQQEALKEKTLDMMVEQKRCEGLKQEKQKEITRKENKKKGFSILKQQIAERKHQKEYELEVNVHENINILQQFEDQKEQDKKDIINKKLKKQKELDEIKQINQQFIDIKQKQKELSIAKEAEISAYIKERDRLEQERRDKEFKEKQSKEIFKDSLQEKQIRLKEKQDKIDLLRSKRSLEDVDRKYREQVKKEIKEKKDLNDQIIQIRQKQINEKNQQIQIEKQKEKDIFLNILNKDKELIEKEKNDIQLKKLKNLEYIKDLKNQISETSSNKTNKLKIIQESINEQNKAESDRFNLIQSVTTEKINELSQIGLPSNYISNIKKHGDIVYNKFKKI